MSERLRTVGAGTWGAVAVAVTALLLFAWKGLPFLTADRPVVYATPTVLSKYSPATITVPARTQACIDQVTIGPDAHLARVFPTGRAATPPLAVTITAGGFTTSGRAAATPAGQPVTVKLRAPDRTRTGATLCVRNDGRAPVAFAAAGPGRSQSISATTVDGQAAENDLSVTLLVADSGSILGNAGRIAGHVAAFRPVTGWMVGLLALLVLLGVPVALAVALMRAAEDDAVER